MAKRNSIGLDININADGFDVSGGTTSRKLSITGGNASFVSSGNYTYTLPATDTLAGLGTAQSFTARQVFTDVGINGLNISSNADNTVGALDASFALTKNDSNTRNFYGMKIKPNLNTGGSNSNTTVTLLDIDTTNNSVTGLTTNLLKASYGGTSRLQLTSAGNLVLGSAALATNATDGFLYLNSTAGLPTGTPTSFTGRVPLNVDTTNGRLYGNFSSGWKNLSSDVYNVIMYGADPTGTNDSLSAFQAARDAAKNSTKGAGIVYIPAGVYKLSNTFQVGDGTGTTVSTYHGIRIIGAGGTRLNSTSTNDGVRLQWSGSAGGTVVKFAGPVGGCSIENVLIDCSGANYAATGISVIHAEGFICRNVQIIHNTGMAMDIDSYDTSTFGAQSVYNGGNTGLVENLFINTTQNGANGVRLGATGNIAQWLFLGGRWRLDGTTGSSVLTLQFADHNTFIGVTGQGETGIRIKAIAAYPEYPHNNFINGSSINGSTNTVLVDSSLTTWNPLGWGMPLMIFPTADGGVIPTDSRFYGLADTRKFFGTFTYRDNLTLEDNITFSSTAKRIKGDFTNATHANRIMFQTSTTNSGTFVGALPVGTGNQSGFLVYSGSDADNASIGRFFANSTFGTIIDSNKTGTGTTSSILLTTNNNTGLTVDTQTTPNVVVGTAAAVSTSATNGFLYLPTCAGTPSGTPTSFTGKSPVVVDTTNNKLYFYSGSWRDSAGAGAAPFTDTTAIVKGSADATKLLRFEVDGFTTGTTRVLTPPDADTTIVGTDTTQTLTNKTINASSNTITLPFNSVANPTSGISMSHTSFNYAATYTTGLFSSAWSGDTTTSSIFKISSTNTSATGYLLDVIADSTSSLVKPFRLQAKQADVLTTDAFGNFVFSPKLQTSGAPVNFTVTGSAHTGLTAGTEITDINFNLARTIQRATGAVSIDRAVRFQGRTLSFVGSSTVSDAINVDIETITASTNATITRSTGLRVKPSVNTHHGLWVDGTVSYAGDAGAFGLSGVKIIRFVGNGGTMNSVFNDNGALSASATDGFQYISRIDSASSPSGTATSYNGSSPIVLQSDTSGGNYRIWSYLNSAWRTFPSTTSTDTLTNKTMSGSSNTFSAIPATALAAFSTLTTATPALNDSLPIYDLSATANRLATLAEIVGTGVEGFISGLALYFSSTSAIGVRSGMAYIQSSGKIIKLSSDTTNSPTLTTTLNTTINSSDTTIIVNSTSLPSAGRIKIDSEEIDYTTNSSGTLTGVTRAVNGTSAASHTAGATVSFTQWYHVYLYDNSGTATLEVSVTEPAAAWVGTARSKNGDTSRRYLGSFKTNSSSQIYNFYHNPVSGYVNWLEDVTAFPFRVISAGTATTETTTSFAAVVPVTARQAQFRMINTSTTGGSNLVFRASSSGPNVIVVRINADFITPVALSTTQTIIWLFLVAPNNTGGYVDIMGYFLER